MKAKLFCICAVAASCLAVSLVGRAADTAAAFEDGKAQKAMNPSIKAAVTSSSPASVPGFSASGTDALKGQYGTDTKQGGSVKATNCENATPGTDAYANQECGTINFVRKNPNVRPAYTIDRRTDPLVVNGTLITGAPQNHVGTASFVNGADGGTCVDVRTQTRAVMETERCSAAKAITEGACIHTLSVSVTWELWAGQSGADLSKGICPPPTVRGDQLPLPPTTSFSDEEAACDANGFGSGTGRAYWRNDCQGGRTKVWFDASRCSIRNAPTDVLPALVPTSCTDAPRTLSSCFSTAGRFTGSPTVPVFTDTVDVSNCAELNAGRASFN